MKATPNRIVPFTLALAGLVLGLLAPQTALAQSFSLDSPLLAARWNHTATLLTNGLVLVAGGETANDYSTGHIQEATNECELYDPNSGGSTLTGSMIDSHFSHTATLLFNGEVLVVGGQQDGGYIITGAELYDPKTGAWTSTGSLQHDRTAYAATALSDGRVLVVGGYSDSGDINGAEIYDPASGVWTNAAPVTYTNDTATATLLLNGKVLVAGGSYNSSALTNAALYNPTNNTWANTSPMHEPRAGHAATLLSNGKVLVVGGTYDTSAEVYDPIAGTWTVVASMSDGRGFPTATRLPSGKVLVIGGVPGQTSAELYDAGNNTWTSTNVLNVGRVFHTATLVAGGQVVVAGGDAGTIGFYNGPALADVETYNQGAQFSPLSAALNATNLVWITGGDANWFVETTNTYDGVMAAQSGTISDSQQTWLQTTVTGPGTLSFWWQVSSESGFDFLEFDLDGTQQDEISGTGQVWAQKSYSITSGTHTLQWLYSKDSSGSDGADAGFLDEVSYAGVPPTPGLTVTASPLTGPVPLTVQFTSPGVDSGGNTVTNWNWVFGDGAASSAQSPSHIYTNVGSFSAALTAYSTYGASPLSVTGPGTIAVTNHTLNVTASPEAGPLPLTVQFTSPSVDSGGNTVTNWSWSFGDCASSTAHIPSHIYTGVGSFSPSLVARSTFGAGSLDITGLGVITVTNTPNPNFRTLYSFTRAFGSDPNGSLVLAGNTLYGTTAIGGASDSGTLFAINTSGSGFTNLYAFNPTSGARPSGVILSGSTFYGPTDIGGTRGGGTVFAISTNGMGYTNLFNLNSQVDPNSPGSPQAPLVLAGNNLYGETWFGGAYDHGTLFSVATNGISSGILHNFTTPFYITYAINSDGIFPVSKMIFSGGTLYGTAEQGGLTSGGAVYAVNTNDPGSFRIVYYFTSPVGAAATNNDGAFPFARLVLSGSTLYGTTYGGGSTGNGAVFAVNTDGSGFTNLHNFTGGNGGSAPHAGLTLSGNTLFGTTSGGGISGNGTLFALSTNGSGFTTLYSFSGGSDGADPETELVLSGNTLYGTANSGGSSGNGTVFSFTLRPQLNITPAGANVILTWPTTVSGYTLQSTLNLGPAASWGPVSPLPVIVNGQNTVTNPISGSHKFYRLSL